MLYNFKKCSKVLFRYRRIKLSQIIFMKQKLLELLFFQKVLPLGSSFTNTKYLQTTKSSNNELAKKTVIVLRQWLPWRLRRWGRSPGEGNGNPLQYSCWRIPSTEEPGRLESSGSPWQRAGHN